MKLMGRRLESVSMLLLLSPQVLDDRNSSADRTGCCDNWWNESSDRWQHLSMQSVASSIRIERCMIQVQLGDGEVEEDDAGDE